MWFLWQCAGLAWTRFDDQYCENQAWRTVVAILALGRQKQEH